MGLSEARKSTWVPHLLFILSAVVLVMAWVQLSDRESDARQLELEVRCAHAAARAELYITTRLVALDGIRDAWLDAEPSDQRFEQLAARASKRYGGFLSIARIDPDLSVRKVYPGAGPVDLAGNRFAKKAVESKRTIVSTAEGMGTERHFNVFVPAEQNGEVVAVVAGTFRSAAVIDAMITEASKTLRFTIRDADGIIGTIGPVANNSWTMQSTRTIKVAGRTWTVTAHGSPEPYALGSWADEALLLGGLLLAFCFFLAIRILVQRRDELEASEARYRTLVDHAPEAILVVDAKDQRIRDANQNAERLFGLSRDGLLASKFAALSPPKQRDGSASADQLDEVIQTALTGGTPTVEWSYSVDGETRPAEMGMVRLPGEAPLIRVAISPLSERLERERAVRESEAQLRRILESTFDGVWVTDRHGATTFVNRRLCQILEMKREDFDDVTMFDLLIERRHTPPVASDAMHGSQSIEYSLRRSDGSKAFVAMRTQAIQDDEGRHRGTVTLVTDLSEARSLEAQLRHAQKMEAIGRLAGGVAHDFNNLLMGVLTACELLEPSVADDPESAELVLEIRTCGQRAATLTRQLLTFGRKDVAQPRVFEVRALVDSVEGILRRVISEDIRLVVQRSDDIGSVYADPVQLEQVLINLAVNASDAMPNGGTLTIDVGATSIERSAPDRPINLALGRHTRITVSDTGEGIAPENLEKIFDPFFTTKDPGRGTGLGLATVHGTITSLGGAITVESVVGKGTTFSMYFPDGGRASTVDLPAAQPISTPGRETILVVEDDASVRKVLERSLSGAGYDVIVADGPRRALELVVDNKRPIHLVVTDVIMPDMSGPVLARELTKVRPDLQILFISGYAGDRLPPEFTLDEGSLLKKPFDAATLTAYVRERLDDGKVRADSVTP